MQVSDLLSAASFLLGLPVLIGLIAGQDTAAKILIAVLAFLVVAAITALYLFMYLPNWTVVDHAAKLKIHDPGGREATYRKTLQLRANRPGLKVYTHRNISADGSVNFSVEPESDIVATDRVAGDFNVTVRFNRQLRWRETIETHLEITLTDGFTSNPEHLIVLIDQQQKNVGVTIELPADKPAQNVRAIHRYQRKEDDLDRPQVTNRNTEITWSHSRWCGFRKLPLGSEYEICWTW